MAIACKYCIMTKGLKGSDIKNLPETDDDFSKHIEQEHHIPVQGENETAQQAMERFRRENPDAGTEKCRCPDCERMRGLLNGNGKSFL